MGRQAVRFYEFGPFRIDASERILLRDGKPVPLTPKAFNTLLVLVENSGRIIDKDALIEKVWPDSFVEEGNLKATVFMLRKALEEDSYERGYIETIPRRGYRFRASVRRVEVAQDLPETEAIKSIAVLPFKPLGGDGGDEYLGLGMADTLITGLSRMSQIIVRPTSAVRRYSDLAYDTLEAGRELMVDSVLDGSIHRAGERIRVTVRLTDVASGRALWADKFDEDVSDIFAVQDSISEQVTRALMLKLSGDEKRRLTRRYTENTEAYHLYLKGRFHSGKWTTEGFQKGVEYFEQAIKMDPTYALAYCGWADAYAMLWSHGYISPQEAMPKVKRAVAKALELDDRLTEAHITLAMIKVAYDWDFVEAEREFRRAIELAPNYPTAHDSYALYLKAMGRHEETIAENRRALELDPLSAWLNATLAWAYYLARQYDQAIEQSWKALELAPDFGITHWTFGVIYLEKGMYEEAIAALERAVRMTDCSAHVLATLGYAYAASGKEDAARQVIEQLKEFPQQGYLPSYEMAMVHTGLVERDRAFAWLDKAYEERACWMVYLNVYPIFDCLRSDERFMELLRRVGLAS